MEVCDGLAPALKYVGELKDKAHEAEVPRIVNLPLEPAGTYGLYDPATKVMAIKTAGTPPRDYRAGNVEAVVKLVDELVVPDLEATERPKAFVFVQDGHIVAILDEAGDRKERVSLSLTMAPAFKVLKNLTGWVGQKAMIDLLRTEIAAKYVPENLLATLRVLKISQDAQGESTVKTGRESMGKRVEAAVAGIDGGDLSALEDVWVTLPVYVDLLDPAQEYRVIEYSVACSFDVDVTEAKFRLKPKAGEIERVLLEADRRIMQDIDANLKNRALVRVFRGSPKN